MMSKLKASTSFSRLSEDKFMTCSKCGAYVTPSVRFCSNCGAAVDHEATRLARVQASALEPTINPDLEHTVFSVRPTMIFIKAGYALSVIAGIALVFLLAGIGVPASISIPIALALVAADLHRRLPCRS